MSGARVRRISSRTQEVLLGCIENANGSTEPSQEPRGDSRSSSGAPSPNPPSPKPAFSLQGLPGIRPCALIVLSRIQAQDLKYPFSCRPPSCPQARRWCFWKQQLVYHWSQTVWSEESRFRYLLAV